MNCPTLMRASRLKSAQRSYGNNAIYNDLPLTSVLQDKALMWKVDRWLIPWLCLLYLLSFLDRTNIGNARLAGMEVDLDMEGHDYNNAFVLILSPICIAAHVFSD
jgi:hypothetical protein